jgi:hypothetical protein
MMVALLWGVVGGRGFPMFHELQIVPLHSNISIHPFIHIYISYMYIDADINTYRSTYVFTFIHTYL